MQTDSLHLEQAHSVFGKTGYSGERAKKDYSAHYKVVRQCIRELNKKGFCECFYEDQVKDIQNGVSFETEAIPIENEIIIRRII